MKYGWKKVSNWECLFVHSEKGLFLSVYVDDIKLAGKKQNIDPMWKVLNEEVDLGEPTSFLDHVYLGCTQRTDDLAQEDLLQKYQERVERLSQQNRVIKFCTDAGFLTTVDVGQYFMTKDTEEFSQFTESVACREYTLPRDEKLSDPKGWIRGSTKIRPVLEVTTSCLQGK